ncbi:Antitoxin CptB protein [Salinisphaera shabanensis E1L3A]|uniref:FAD assembly factor SdhE n=1 Tax=Salinisphaera shabanensis E1L3A TaxID=1033802 RepID=U2FVC6_9GAMM|nr:succinate dehydrogenase assembly factor 2 [Salinisphaera shabanensis]ERJ18273.1 Antitoxin CptB protein [Salinisphaera shabanensis E1L3A]
MSEKARIRWLCRRGMKELDVLLERFVSIEYDDLDEREQTGLRELVEMEDPDLYALVMGRMEPETAVHADLLSRIRQFQRPQGTAR